MIGCANPLVSVVVNVYNEHAFISQCLDSVINQTYSNLEIIVVDDGSTDGTDKICQEYSEKHETLVCIIKKNQGLVRARKDGLLSANGEYIAFIDGDDWIDPNWIETNVNAALESSADVVVAGFMEDLEGRITINRNRIKPGVYSGEALEKEVYPYMLNSGEISQFGIFTYLWCKLFKKDVLAKSLLAVDDSIFIGEDACTLYPALLESSMISIIENNGYHYRQRPGSMVKSVGQQNTELKRLKLLARYLLSVFEKSQYVEVMLPQLDAFLLSQVIVRTDGMDIEGFNRSFFPFRGIEPGSAVAIYGSGTFGQQVFRRVSSDPRMKIVAWVDPHCIEYSHAGLKVSSIDSLKFTNQDYVLVAIADASAQSEAIEYLEKLELEQTIIKGFSLTATESEYLINQLLK